MKESVLQSKLGRINEINRDSSLVSFRLLRAPSTLATFGYVSLCYASSS